MKAARTERPYYIIHLYEFLEQTNLIYNSGKQIRPAGGDRKWTSKGHEETVRAMEMLCVVYVLLTYLQLVLEEARKCSFSIKKEKARFPDSATGNESQ